MWPAARFRFGPLIPCALAWSVILAFAAAEEPKALPATAPLAMQGDIASELVSGVDRFLLKELEASIDRRSRHWHRDVASRDAYERSVEANRKRLAHILGVRDQRTKIEAPELISTTDRPAKIAEGHGYEVFAIRWPVFEDVHGEGLLLSPVGRAPVASVVAIGDCEQTPEQLAGLAPGVAAESQFARRLAESGCRVVVPALVSRRMRSGNLSDREWLYRSAFELGRGLRGEEVQKILACVDWFASSDKKAPIGVMGWGEGGLLALDAGALDTRIDAVAVSGYFDNRQETWREPIDRNVFGLLEEFGDAELASLVAPRTLIVEAARGPEFTIPSGGRGAPGRTTSPTLSSVQAEVARAKELVDGLHDAKIELVESGEHGAGSCGSAPALTAFLQALAPDAQLAAVGDSPKVEASLADADARQQRQVAELDRHHQRLLADCARVRDEWFWKKLDFSSLEAYQTSIEPFRKIFAEEIIGRFDRPLSAPNARTRLVQENDRWSRYEVVLDVFPDVIAYGLLTLPKHIREDERRPVVVCQHGLEGRPQDTIGEAGFDYYKAFSTQLAERGFITFAPQNLYIFGDRFRTLQRKANPLKKTLFSVIGAQHQQIVDWLETLPEADPERIGFYGLSYGGKTAMRVPAVVTDYALSICSGDFNEWVDKNASTRNPHSYVETSEYEIFEFDLGNTFNYAEMAALIAPRPFMVERGHDDGVASDETVAFEYAKVRRLYVARLGAPERTEIEWFLGPHKINGKGTFRFLESHLRLR
jgi:dienelactone hydrolase